MLDRRTFCLGLLPAFALSLATLPAFASVTVAQVENAETVQEFLALGARKLTAKQFKAKIVGKPMAGDGWTWIIDTDGTTSSESLDGSWKEVAQPWSMKGDTYCTVLNGKKECRDVYMIGKYLRMSDPEDAKKLATWTAKLK